MVQLAPDMYYHLEIPVSTLRRITQDLRMITHDYNKRNIAAINQRNDGFNGTSVAIDTHEFMLQVQAASNVMSAATQTICRCGIGWERHIQGAVILDKYVALSMPESDIFTFRVTHKRCVNVVHVLERSRGRVQLPETVDTGTSQHDPTQHKSVQIYCTRLECMFTRQCIPMDLVTHTLLLYHTTLLTISSRHSRHSLIFSFSGLLTR